MLSLRNRYTTVIWVRKVIDNEILCNFKVVQQKVCQKMLQFFYKSSYPVMYGFKSQFLEVLIIREYVSILICCNRDENKGTLNYFIENKSIYISAWKNISYDFFEEYFIFKKIYAT